MKANRRKRDLELEAGAKAHFEDPDYYAVTYAQRKADVAFYQRVARGHDRLLEYGIGSGRIALPIARDGVSVWGIDHSIAMLRDLRARLAREPEDVRARVKATRGDMRKARVRKRFPLVLCPFNTALHLYKREDVEQWLARVREHLEPRGALVMDLSMPILEDLADEPGTSYTLKPFVHPSAGPVRYREVFDYDRVRQILFVAMCFEPKARDKESFTVPLAHRQYFPREWEALLHYNGFEGGPLAQDSDVMVWHARKRRS